MSLDSQGINMQGTDGIGGAGRDKEQGDNLSQQDKELIDIITKSPGDASQIIQASFDKNTAIGTLEGLKNKVDGIGRADLKASIDKVIQAIADNTQPIKYNNINKIGTPDAAQRPQQVNQIRHIDKAEIGRAHV